MPKFRTEKDKFILERCKGKRVLDVGCVNHNLDAAHLSDWRHKQISMAAARVVGLDYEKEAVEHLNGEGWNIIAADAQNFDVRDQYPEGFEVIIASEIIEHLTNPGGFLTSLAKHLAPGGQIVITTPHAYGFGFFLEVLVWGEEHVNDDHTLTFSRKNMKWLLKKSGLKMIEFHWLIQDTTHLPLLHITTGAKVAAKIFFWLQCAAAFIRPGFSKEMIVIACPDLELLSNQAS